MTIKEIKALSDSALDEAIAETLMGWTRKQVQSRIFSKRGKPIGSWYDEVRWYPPEDPSGKRLGIRSAPIYTQRIELAWQVVERIMRIPESKAEATTAPNTRFLYAFERATHTLVCSSEQEAARWICEQALAAWTAGPLFPEESEG